jgi:hypothetical protein
MTTAADDNVSQEENPHRRPYRAPRLIVYGAVRDLTAGGSGKAPESVKSTAAPRKI